MEQYKRYNRLNSIPLPAIKPKPDQLRRILISRSSYRGFSKKPIELRVLSEILYYSAGLVREVNGRSREFRRPYPSAGAKYPLEIYPLVFFGKDISQGLYHYNMVAHSLEVLLSPVLKNELEGIWMSQKWFRKAAVILIITAVYQRTTNKYGQSGLPFPFIEAGHLGQNLYLICETLGIGCSAIGQFKEKGLIKLLDIDPNEEIPVYYVAIGG